MKEIPVEELEFGVEDWGSFENAIAGLEAQTNTKVRMATAAALLGVNVEDEPAAGGFTQTPTIYHLSRVVTAFCHRFVTVLSTLHLVM